MGDWKSCVVLQHPMNFEKTLKGQPGKLRDMNLFSFPKNKICIETLENIVRRQISIYYFNSKYL